MYYAVLALITLCTLAAALFYFLRTRELATQLRQADEAWEEKEEEHAAELARLDQLRADRVREHEEQLRQVEESWRERVRAYAGELSKLEHLRHIPDVIERAKKTKADAEARLADARLRAESIVERAVAEAKARSGKLHAEAEQETEASRAQARKLIEEAATINEEAREEQRISRWMGENALEEARKEARDVASKTRKEAKEKREKSEAALDLATRFANDIRRKAEQRAREIAGEAVEVKGKVDQLRAAAEALRNRIEGYEGVYLVPTSHVLDELAEEFGHSSAGDKLRLARERTRLMRENGTAAACGYPDGWKRDHALRFVLGTFDGKVDTVLSRLKPGNQGKLIQEIRDAYAFVNKDGEVYKDARIEEEYLDARLEEVKWATAVQKLKEKSREEQRAIREQIREEERARKEIERAIKQTQREEDLVNKAIARVRKQLEEAGEAEKTKYEAQLQELDLKLVEAEERNKKTMSMAQQTKRGHVYVISNVGSFGDGVYKIGLTRRLDPTERVRELGDASVPFPFDVHAMLKSDDAPALENALHKRFVEKQVNKINKRKEFFRVGIQELRQVVEELGIEASWTMVADASQYQETLALEQAMVSDADLRFKWLEEQATLDIVDDETVDAEQELEEVEA